MYLYDRGGGVALVDFGASASSSIITQVNWRWDLYKQEWAWFWVRKTSGSDTDYPWASYWPKTNEVDVSPWGRGDYKAVLTSLTVRLLDDGVLETAVSMNPWTQVAIETLRSLRKRPGGALRDPVRVLGDFKGLGQSHIVALATPDLAILALVSPSSRVAEGWILEHSIAPKVPKSPSGTVSIGCFNFIGLWFILGTIKNAQVTVLRFRLRDGTEVDANPQEGGFLVIRELDPVPFEITVLKQDGHVLERLRFPPQSSSE